MQDLVLNLQNTIIPSLFWAVVVFIIGFFISKKFGDIVAELLEKIKLTSAMKSLGWVDFLGRYDTKLDATKFFGAIVRIFFMILTIMISIEILGFYQLTQFFLEIIKYYPNIFIASIIFIVAVFIAQFSKKIVFASSGKELKYSNIVGDALSTGTWVLAILAILYQLQIVPNLILALFIGVIALLVLTFGISFGVGGIERAKKFLDGTHKKTK